MNYAFEHWQYRYWETPERYYSAQLQQNLFGDWCIVCSWGGKTNHRRNSMTIDLESIDNAEKRLMAIAKRRKSRGYAEVIS